MAQVSVWIAHYFHPGTADQPYGSLRATERPKRALALARNVAALLAMQRQATELVLSPEAGGWLQAVTPAQEAPRPASLRLTLHVCVLGEAWLREALEPFAADLQLHSLDGIEPRQLPAATRDALVHDPQPSDLSVYLEDDLILLDPRCLEKWLWFAEHTRHGAVLMPHRFERGSEGQRLWVDGPINSDYLRALGWPQGHPFEAAFAGEPGLTFQIASNPHSGMFAISAQQRHQLQQCCPLPCEGFVGPLESVATATVGRHWPIYKPAWAHRQFLAIEHGHPVFQQYLVSLRQFAKLAN